MRRLQLCPQATRSQSYAPEAVWTCSCVTQCAWLVAARAANASLDAPKTLALRVAEKAPRVLCLDAATLAARVNGLVASLGARAASDACSLHGVASTV